MTNQNTNRFRHAAFALALAASFGLAGAQAQDISNPGQDHSNAAGDSQSTAAAESAPVSTPGSTAPTVAPTSSGHASAAHPSTSSDEPQTTNRCAYDLNGDGAVDFVDYIQLLSLLASEGETAGPANIGFDDIIGLMSEWGGC